MAERRIETMSDKELIELALKTQLEAARVQQKRIDIEALLIARGKGREAARAAGRKVMLAHLENTLAEAKQPGPTTRATVRAIALRASHAVHRGLVPEENTTSYQNSPYAREFESGMRQGIREWSHTHNHELMAAKIGAGQEMHWSDLKLPPLTRAYSQAHHKRIGHGFEEMI